MSFFQTISFLRRRDCEEDEDLQVESIPDYGAADISHVSSGLVALFVPVFVRRRQSVGELVVEETPISA